MKNCEIVIWTFADAAGYAISNPESGKSVEIDEGSPKEGVLRECQELSLVTGFPMVLNGFEIEVLTPAPADKE